MKRKKAKYKHAVIDNKRYYFYSIRWVDIMGDSSHASKEEFSKDGACIYKHTCISI